ncbi:hypothetical protein SAMN05216379_11082 [Nitrosomonas eutropha]|uniref:hypothetical protein n=1 Tax=Nitrosomonas TaxID=914 RepID=UPI000882BD2E|nr:MULTISPECIES: hypothetical protein [Nitrosomonas]SCX16422.1 hypothetical protein SAMN05216379_11082 [Nitrosomonas eutropha]
MANCTQSSGRKTGAKGADIPETESKETSKFLPRHARLIEDALEIEREEARAACALGIWHGRWHKPRCRILIPNYRQERFIAEILDG